MLFDSVNDSVLCGLDKGLSIGKGDSINRVMGFVLWRVREVVSTKVIIDRGQETIQVLAVVFQNDHTAPLGITGIEKAPGDVLPEACMNVLEPGADGWGPVLRGARPRCIKKG